jgi:hypothetical protein
MQSRVLGDLLQSQRLGMLLQHVEQPHHALDYLDRIFLFVFRRSHRERAL